MDTGVSIVRLRHGTAELRLFLRYHMAKDRPAENCNLGCKYLYRPLSRIVPPASVNFHRIRTP